jgi:hypothetical protein
MQKVHFYFFCLYNAIYKDGFEMQNYYKATGRAKILPERRAILTLFFSSWLWTIVLRLVIIALFRPSFKILILGVYEYLVVAIIYSAYYFYFIDNNRFNDIYVRFRNTDKAIQRQTLKKIIILLVLPLLLIPILCLAISKFTTIDLTQQINTFYQTKLN